MKHTALEADQLYTRCDPSLVPFKLTSDVDASPPTMIGQARALEAIEFGIGMVRPFYNLFLVGSIGLGKRTLLNRILTSQVHRQPTPSDWCYVNNFAQFYKPQALQLPAGGAAKLSKTMDQLVEDLLIGIPTAFESQEYRAQLAEIGEITEQRREQTFASLNKKAKKDQIALMRTPSGYTLVPLDSKDKPMDPKTYDKLPEKRRKVFEKAIDHLKGELKSIILNLPVLQKESIKQIKTLNQGYAESTIDQFILPLLETYQDNADVTQYLKTVRSDMIDHFDHFLPNSEAETPLGDRGVNRPPTMQKYRINILVDQSDAKGAPIIYEDNPSYNNLVGRVEHLSEYGSLVTNFSLIKPGALHHANGGYLILDAEKLLTKPYAWEGLKRVLRAGEVKIESLEQMLSLVTTISLEPEAIPVQLKVILIGSRRLYYLLKAMDPDFVELFKTTADFAETLDRNADSTADYSQLIAEMTIEADTLPVNQAGVSRMIEACARDVADAEKLSLHQGRLRELLVESDYWAAKNNQNHIDAQAVNTAIDAKIQRLDQIRERSYEQILRGNLLIDTADAVVGQVNGLAVMQMGDFAFGQPSRITATARLGQGKLIDIERETKMGGPIHSKAVMILSSCLAHRYAREHPLSLSATLVFEQNYGGIEGDSASLAEFCVLVSAITGIPLGQNWAITGSMNQHGQAQAIGGVNEKIEGFFDICESRGLTGKQGVIIPQANVKHLMLHHKVRVAVIEGKFHVHAVDTVNQALGLLTGMPAGETDKDGNYPDGSVNQLVIDKLNKLHKIKQRLNKPAKSDNASEADGRDESEEENE